MLDGERIHKAIMSLVLQDCLGQLGADLRLTPLGVPVYRL
jgi:hypothetical protein